MSSVAATTTVTEAEAADGGRRQPGPASGDGGGSYRDILKSSAMIGASSAINIGFGMVRTKAMAVILGPSGYGVLGGFAIVADLAKSVAQMGVNASGVRQIAESAASGDVVRVSKTAIVLRRASIGCAVLGAVVLSLLSDQVSQLTFGSPRYANSIVLLSLAVMLGLLAAGETALLQGLRRIADLARINILGAAFGTLAGVPLVYFFGERGIVPSLVIVAGASLAVSWWYGRKVEVAPVSLALGEALQESAALFRLGVVFMLSGLLTLGAAYVVRIILLRQLGTEAAGLYQAAWTLGGLYIGFVLQAMGTDFYPKLVGAASDHEACNRLVNEQTRISLLLSMPGVVATLTFAPLAIYLFYAASFGAATEILRWICLGMALRVLTWPLGYIVVAKNRQRLFFATDLLWTLANIGLTLVCVDRWGAMGAGIAFFGSYLFHWALVYPIARHLTGFRWSASNARTISAFLALIAVVFVSTCMFSMLVATLIGTAATLASTYFSVRALAVYAPNHRVPAQLRRLLNIRG